MIYVFSWVLTDDWSISIFFYLWSSTFECTCDRRRSWTKTWFQVISQTYTEDYSLFAMEAPKVFITAKVGMSWWRCPTTWVFEGPVFSKDHCFEICVVCFVGLCFLLVSCLTKEAEMSLSACLQRSFNIQQRAIVMPTNVSCMIYESTVLF